MDKKGITLIGVMVSLTIMTVGLVALLTLVNSTLLAAIDVRSKVEASSLMYDAFETIRNIRDTNILSKLEEQTGAEVWNNGNAGEGYIFNQVGSYVVNCDTANCTVHLVNNSTDFIEPDDSTYKPFRLFQDESSGIINHDENGASLRYYRQIIIDEPPCDPNNVLELGCTCSDINDPSTCNRIANDHLKEVTVYVTWIETDKKKRTVKGQTYIGNWSVDEI